MRHGWLVAMWLAACDDSGDALREPVCGDGVTDPVNDCDDGNLVDFDGCSATCEREAEVKAEWWFEEVATNTMTTECPRGFETVRVVHQPTDADGNETGDPFIDTYACTDRPSRYLARGWYRSWIEVTNGAEVFARSVPQLRGVSGGTTGTSFHTIVQDGGYFALAWRLRNASSGNELTCHQANQYLVRIVVTLTSQAGTSTQMFDCKNGQTLTAPVLAGTYAIGVVVQTETMTIGTFDGGAGHGIQAPNLVTDLGTFDIPVTPSP